MKQPIPPHARVFIKEVIARHGLRQLLLSDKASGYMSQFFATITQILGIRHRTSAAQCSRSNGLAEQAVKRLNEGLKRYANDDVDDRRIEIILPLIEFGLRATAPINRKISPFEICHGFSMPIATPFEYNLPQFLPARRNASAGYSDRNVSVCLSVCPSVTRRYCVKTKKASGMIFSPSGSPKTLVF